MSASIKLIAWKFAIGRPNCLRSLAYLIDSGGTCTRRDLTAVLYEDKEENNVSQDLSSYQDRFLNIQDNLSFEQKKEESEYVWQPFKNGNSFSQPVEPINPWQQETEPEIKEVPVQEVKQEESYFDNFKMEEQKQDTLETFTPIKETNDRTPVEAIKEVFEDVEDNSGEIISLKERDTYLNQTFSDVNSYNINNGQQTIDQLVDKSVEEVRHPENPTVENNTYEEPIDNTRVWAPLKDEILDADEVAAPKIDDEEFSNTVSMEISKIMDEIAATPVEEAKPEVVEQAIEEPAVQEINETIEINEEVVEEKTDDVVEIKNISEIEAEPVKDTMSNTIPFIVAAEDEEMLEEETDGSNTVLNVILIVLIVVLVAVLGLIVFYILKTKGIF